jgi:hypothetical protein
MSMLGPNPPHVDSPAFMFCLATTSLNKLIHK